MKNLIYIAICLLFACKPQARREHSEQKCTKDSLAIAPELLPYFESFIEDCESRGINSDHAYCLQHIGLHHCKSLMHRVQGETDFECGTIEINNLLLSDKVGTKFVVYHELGHWMGLRHSEGIMKESYSSSDSALVAEKWDELMEDYFNKLKNAQ